MSAEYQSFRRHFADLSESIQNPTTLASRLYSAEILSREKRNNIGSLQLSVEQIGQLLDAVESQIKVDSQNFYKFCGWAGEGQSNVPPLWQDEVNMWWGEVVELLATLLPNIVSLTHLEVIGEVTESSMPVFITTVQSLHMLEVLKLTSMYTVRPHKNLVSESVYSTRVAAITTSSIKLWQWWSIWTGWGCYQ